MIFRDGSGRMTGGVIWIDSTYHGNELSELSLNDDESTNIFASFLIFCSVRGGKRSKRLATYDNRARYICSIYLLHLDNIFFYTNFGSPSSLLCVHNHT